MKLDSIFTDHMVFAAGKPVRVYGEGEGLIRVRLGGSEREVRAENGRFMAELPAMPCGGAYELCVQAADECVVLSDVWVGEVYLCAGQSNMQLKLKETDFAPERYADERRLRFFTLRRVEAGEAFTPEDGWMCSEKDHAAQRGAIGYIMGMERVRQSGAAVGIVGCWQGGSVIESWLPAGICEERGIALAGEDRYADPCRAEWWNAGGVLYENMFLQAVPFSFSGVVWYQGESNGREAEGRLYEAQLRTLIERWRGDLRDEKLPFVIVQLPDFFRPASKAGWAMVQQAQQTVAQTTENVHMAVSRDVCETTAIHPIRKEALALRIAQACSGE